MKTSACDMTAKWPALPSVSGPRPLKASLGPAERDFTIPGAVAIVDDEADTRIMLEDILTRSGRYYCAGSYSSAYQALELIPRIRPQLVFMDIRMPGMSGIECARRIKATLPQLKIIILTGVFDPASITEASRAGSDGYLTKPFTADQLLASLRFALSSGSQLPKEINPIQRDAPPNSRRADGGLLTVRENEVMKFLAKGYLYKEIEAQMHLSGSVVKKVQHKIFLKLGVSNRTEAVSRWLREQ
jgi:DNA-binding NarL/FixJ family response regulator